MCKEENHIIFKAKAITLLDDDEAFERTSIPEWWEKSICRRILRNPYTAYYWYTHCVQHGFYNKVTDYKGIWGLTSLPKGSMNGFYDVDDGRVYWGVIEENEPKALKHDSNVVILLPENQPFPDKQVKEVFEKHRIGFFTYPSKAFFEELKALLPSAYVIHDSETGDSVLEVWGNKVEQIFEEEDCHPLNGERI